MKVLGLDPGSRYTGYGIVEKRGNDLRHVASGRINATKGDTFADRLPIIYEGLTALLDEFECDIAAVESIFTAHNARSSIKLGHARGVSLLAIKHAELVVHEYPPAKVKLAVAGHGRADKESVCRIVKKLLGVQGELSHDASDALAVAICHCQAAQFEARVTAAVEI